MRSSRVGKSAVGEPLRSWGNSEMQCRLGELAPAHTVLQFAYGERAQPVPSQRHGRT